MGNYRFRLSDMLPNAWFYKLRDMNKSKSNSHSHNKLSSYVASSSTTTASKRQHQYQYQCRFAQPRDSVYYTPRLDPSPAPKHPKVAPRKSAKKPRKTVYKPSPKNTRPTTESTQPDHDTFFSPGYSHEHPNKYSFDSPESTQSLSRPVCSCRHGSSTTDIVIDVHDGFSTKKIETSNGFTELELVKLPPIITKPVGSQNSVSVKKETPGRKSTSGVKLRANSPKITMNKRSTSGNHKNPKSRKNQNDGRKNLTESFAIVKSSFDPQRDFMESMMEMITENNIRSSKDLEDLLACYLSLNSDEYHEVIVKAFEQIWFTLPAL